MLIEWALKNVVNGNAIVDDFESSADDEARHFQKSCTEYGGTSLYLSEQSNVCSHTALSAVRECVDMPCALGKIWGSSRAKCRCRDRG